MSATVLAFPAHRRAPSPAPAAAPVLRLLDPPSADPRIEAVADVLALMEARPAAAPVIRVVRGLDRRVRVHVAVGDAATALSAEDARLLAKAIRAEPGRPAALADAHALDAAAQLAERRDAPLVPSRLGVSAWVVALMAVAALILAATVAAMGA